MRQMAGCWSARRGAYRIVYAVDEEDHRALVVRIEHRADVCRPVGLSGGPLPLDCTAGRRPDEV